MKKNGIISILDFAGDHYSGVVGLDDDFLETISAGSGDYPASDASTWQHQPEQG